MTRDKSTTQIGDEFRDTLASLLGAAGFRATAEVLADYKKADLALTYLRDDVDGVSRYLVEAKSYTNAVPQDECTKFVSAYKPLVDDGTYDRAWLVSRGPISTTGRRAIERHRNLRCFTYQELQRSLLNFDDYLRDLIRRYDSEKIASYYIPPTSSDGEDLNEYMDKWIEEENSNPVAIVAGYGRGKTTFALHFSACRAQKALDNPNSRIPILIPLGDTIDDITLESLIGKMFSSQFRLNNYHFSLFTALNNAGKFVILFDGFDEMKHGMSIGMFDRAVQQLTRLDAGDGKLLFLGRDTAFHSDEEFRFVIQGRQTTSLGRVAPRISRRPFTEKGIRELTEEEVERYVRGYFPLRLKELHINADNDWISKRINELLSDDLKELINRPVHAKMLCEIATSRNYRISVTSSLDLYDRFVTSVLERETSKRMRDPDFGIRVRREFNARVAWRRHFGRRVRVRPCGHSSLPPAPAGRSTSATSGTFPRSQRPTGSAR